MLDPGKVNHQGRAPLARPLDGFVSRLFVNLFILYKVGTTNYFFGS